MRKPPHRRDDVECFDCFSRVAKEEAMKSWWRTGNDAAGSIWYCPQCAPQHFAKVENNRLAAEQNKKMRAWFEKRTGLVNATLSEHMAIIDKLLSGKS